MKSTFVLLALISWSSALAEPFALGPWRLGMSEEQVRAFSEYGPYTSVSATGGLETQNATFNRQRKSVSAVFGEYEDGGFGAFFADLQRELRGGELSALFLLFSPWLLWQLVRLLARAAFVAAADQLREQAGAVWSIGR